MIKKKETRTQLYRRLKDSGMCGSDIAKKCGVSRQAVSQSLNFKYNKNKYKSQGKH